MAPADPAAIRAGPSHGPITAAHFTIAHLLTSTESPGQSASGWCGGMSHRGSGSVQTRRTSCRPNRPTCDLTGVTQPHGMDALGGDDPFIMEADGKCQLFVPSGLKDGPLPTHYEPVESPVANPMYRQQINPAAKLWPRPGNEIHAPAGSALPIRPDNIPAHRAALRRRIYACDAPHRGAAARGIRGDLSGAGAGAWDCQSGLDGAQHGAR